MVRNSCALILVDRSELLFGGRCTLVVLYLLEVWLDSNRVPLGKGSEITTELRVMAWTARKLWSQATKQLDQWASIHCSHMLRSRSLFLLMPMKETVLMDVNSAKMRVLCTKFITKQRFPDWMQAMRCCFKWLQTRGEGCWRGGRSNLLCHLTRHGIDCCLWKEFMPIAWRSWQVLHSSCRWGLALLHGWWWASLVFRPRDSGQCFHFPAQELHPKSAVDCG